jgi:probable HAF family extracellular repeat protein
MRRSLAAMLLAIAVNAYATETITNLDEQGNIFSTAITMSANGKVIIGVYRDEETYDQQVYKYTEDGGRIVLGNLGGSESYITGLSADGAVITGYGYTADYEEHAFKYTDSTGMVDLGTLGGDTSYANAVSADGSTVIGWSNLEVYGGIRHAFKHTDKSGMVDLGTLGGGFASATAVSANGSVVVGYSTLADNSSHAFKHTDNDGMLDLGTLGGKDSYAIAVSADGAVIAGHSQLANDQQAKSHTHAFKYTEKEGMLDLGTLGGDNSSVRNVSSDGSTIIGDSEVVKGSYTYHAYKYTDDGGMKDLGTLGGNVSSASSVSADGSVVVGSSHLANGQTHAFKHTDTDGMVALPTLGGYTSYANSVSADGKVIAGFAATPDYETHGVLWKNDIIVDSTNTRTALAQTAQQATQVLDMRSAQLQMLMQQDCSVGAGEGRFCMGAGATYSGASKARSTAASFTLGYQINPQWRIGTTIHQSLDSSLPSEYKSSNNLPGVGVFTTFNARKDGLGWQARVAAAYQTSKVDINRKQLSYTEGGIGRANLDGKAAAVEGSYRMLASNGVIIAPYAALRYNSVYRSAYSESNDLAFVGRYAEMGRSATSVEAGLRIGKTINSKLNLSANIGVTRDISVDNRGFRVAMDYVGGFALGNGKDERTRAHLGLQGSYALAEGSAIQGGIYWAQQAYGNDSTSAQFRLIKQF